jgi:N-methylhydantoinase B
MRVLADAELCVRAERVRLPPRGLAGGLDGRAGGNAIERAGAPPLALPGKVTNQRLAAGDVFVLRTSGGGGIGPPSERAREAVLADLREGFVTREGAARDYGVASDEGTGA